MGQKYSAEEQHLAGNMKVLKSSTKFTAEEIRKYYEKFQKDFPDGKITKEEFAKMYTKANTTGDSRQFATYVFKAYDVDKNGSVDFKVYFFFLTI